MHTATSTLADRTAAAAAESSQTHARSTWRLPVELLIQCLMACDAVTRIRASHVCRTWSEVALAERRLWDTFSCTEFRNQQDEDAMFSCLQTMLLRSQPLPFHLHVPHSLGGRHSNYQKRFSALKAFDIQRIAAYHGPAHIFEQLKPSRAILPGIVSLDLLYPYDSEPYSAGVEMHGELTSRFLPNLQQLSAPSACFPADGSPLLALRSVAFACMQGLHHRALFTHCPNLVRFAVADSPMGTPLPDPPVPPSLREISMRCVRPRALDVDALMRHWHAVRVPRFVAREVYSLQAVLPLFLASHSQAIEIRLPGGADDVVLSAGTDDRTVWTLSPSPPWAGDFLASIEKPTSARLTSISVAFSRIGELLCAQLHAPGLQRLEIRLDFISNADSPRLESGGVFFLRAPRLRTVSFNLVHVDACTASLENGLAVLRTSFRSLFVYDAELLDTIIVSRHAEAACAGFGPLAKEYMVLSGRC